MRVRFPLLGLRSRKGRGEGWEPYFRQHSIVTTLRPYPCNLHVNRQELCGRITARAKFAMKKLAAFVLLGTLTVGLPVAASAQPRTRTMSESPASRKASRKQQKAMKKYAKAQRKAQRKMLRTERKNSRRF